MQNTQPLIPQNASYSLEVRQVLAKKKRFWNVWSVLGLILAIAILIYSGILSDLSFVELVEGTGSMVNLVSKFFPPDFTRWWNYFQATIETIAMGIWGTLLAVIVAIPLSILASENVCPNWIVFPVRRLLDAMRAINELVFALIFIVAVGLGPFAGVLALFVHTAGTLGKLFSEAIEAIDPGPVEGIRATGASKIQEIIFGVIPQVIPLWTSFALYRFESNVRSASVLGIVGAGGIGVTLYQNFRAFNYQNVCAILIILVVTVGIIDTISARIRNRLV
ncbi:phosphonate ABC transporter, permease protein PhnE [Oscillatoria sp. CS-180]|uniref:phosphonate ABC transporter, permease protein PhnE n=1 Tax=Oscillatoria sp. CS-180 TaxID=3021720 RepID=UPI00232D15C4|nr:phosphonate ABC transporter, permease protein PhnE [Oscillatoria sp. CS-180]MDB9529038.1 phosphonate ABC transporter, permease protein PhnE [Oscillatoria sp. CS-180]